MDAFEQLTKNSTRGAERLQVRTVLNPILWLVLFVSIPCLSSAYFFRDFPAVLAFLLFLVFLPVAVAIWAFCYCLVYRPEDLRSEEHLKWHHTLQLVSDKSVKMSPEVATAVLRAVSQVKTMSDGS